jgi:nitroimidazol reductase NimA-like FMN-containing flavoprotein (pyridoxamine 5'-phosphate oxidase superfamily)
MMDENNKDEIRGLLTGQPVGVLSTEYEGQPYASLVAYTATADLKTILFATERSTRKYMNMSVNPKVAILVDNRTNKIVDIDKAIAVTAMGAVEEAKDDERKTLSGIYLMKHPEFAGFLQSAALMKLRVENYIIVKGLKRITVIDML